MSLKKIVLRALIFIPVLVVCLIPACGIILNTAWFRNYLRSQIEAVALDRAGVRLTVGSVATHWTRLGIDLNDLTVYAAATAVPLRQPALVQANQLAVQVRLLPLLRGRIELRELTLDRPIVHVRFDAQGRSNLPLPPHPSSSSTSTDEIFNLQIADCEIRHGEIFYNDARSPLDGEFHDLKFNAGYALLTGNYQGSFSYERGSLRARAIGPIASSLKFQFNASRTALSVDPFTLKSPGSQLNLHAELTNYSSLHINLTYDGSVSTAELAQVLHDADLPRGTVALTGSLSYQSRPQQPLVRSLILKGQAQSDRLTIPTGSQPIVAGNLTAMYSLKGATLQVQDLNADILGGHGRASYRLAHMDAGVPATTVEAAIQGISLENASAALATPDIKRIPFVGSADLTTKAFWSGSPRNAFAQAKLTITTRSQSAPYRKTIPVSGLIQATYDGPQNTISFAHSHLQTAKTWLDINGSLCAKRNQSSTLTLLATTGDLSEVGDLASVIENATRRTAAPFEIPALGGSASLTVRATGSVTDPRIQGLLSARQLSVEGTHWTSLALNLAADRSGISVPNGRLDAQAGQRITFNGHAGLQHGSLVDSSPVQLNAAVANMPIALVRQVAHLDYPITGVINARLNVTGTKAAPVGQASLTVSQASAWNEPIHDLTVVANAQAGTIHSMLNLEIPAGTISGGGSYTLASQAYAVNLTGKSIDFDKISALQTRAGVRGTVELEASGSGSLREPQFTATLNSPQITTAGEPITDFHAEVNVANQRADLALHSFLQQGALDAAAQIALTGAHDANLTMNVRALPVATVAANFLPSLGGKIGGQTDLHVSASGPLSRPAAIEAHLEIPSFHVTYGKAQMALTRTLIADYRAGTLIIMPAQIQGTGANLTFGGSIPIKSNAAYSLAADGTLDLRVLQQFAAGVKSSGQMEVHVHSAGRGNAVQGQFQVKNAVFTSETSPIGIESLNAQINLSGTRAELSNFSGTAGGGQITARGYLDFAHSPSYSLAVNANSVRIRYPEGLRSVLSGQVNLQGSSMASSLTGRVSVDSLSFTQAFDLANFAGYFSEDASGGAPSRLAQNMRLNLGVDSSQNLNLASSKLSVGGSANLNVVGTLARPVILGRIALNSGEVFFLGKRFSVQSGTIQFANPTRTEPVLHMFINTTIEQYNITLNLSGPIDQLRTNYSSDPALPPVDIIHLLAFGNTNAEAASQPSQSAAMGAESVLAQGIGSQVAGKLENVTGISQLTIDPLAANNSGDPGAQIAIQQRVTGSLLFTFSTNVTTTQGETVELQYDFSRRASITVLRDQYGGYGIDLRLHKVF